MPLDKSGLVFPTLHGSTVHEQLTFKIQEMRKELRHIEQVLNLLEGQARMKTPVDLMKPHFSKLFWWYLSAMESFVAMSWGAFGDQKTKEMLKDFQRRFSMWT